MSSDFTSSVLPVAVIGCGRMGRFHARAYAQMPQARLVGVYDARPECAAPVAGDYQTRVFDSLDQLLPQVAAVTIATPTQHHLAAAEPFLRAGVACLIEKPLAADSAEGRRLVELARQHRALVQVGHIERFNPAIRALRQLKLTPRFMDVVRISPLTFRSMDVGVVLDMMIHDLDILLKLAGAPVQRVEAVGVGVVGGAEDVCNARLQFANGCVANVTASRLALKTERRLRFFCPEAFVSVDYQKRSGAIVRQSGNLDALRQVAARAMAGQIADFSQISYPELVKIEPLAVEATDPLRSQLESFLEAVRDGSPPDVTAEDGLAAVELAERIVQSAAAHRL